MKKIAFILSGALLAFGCSEEDNLSTENGVNYTRTLIENWESFDYEEYDYPQDYEDVLQGYFDIMETGTALANKSIEETVWIMEGGMNYLNNHPAWLFDETLEQELSYTLALDENNLVSGEDITIIFTEFYNYVESNKPVDHQFLASDVFVQEINSGGDIKLGISVLWAQDPTLVSGNTGSGPEPALFTREAGNSISPCNSITETTVDDGNVQFIGKDLAFKGYKKMKYGNQNPYPHFPTSTVRYATNPDPGFLPIGSGKLFGNQNSVVPQYNTLHDLNTCLTTNQIDQYSQVMFDQFFSTAGTTRRVIFVDMRNLRIGTDVAWLYDKVTIAEWPRAFKDPSFNP